MRKKQKNGYWGSAKRIEVVSTYLIVGNAPMTEAITNVPAQTIRHWKCTEWWKDIERELKEEDNSTLSVKLKKIIDKSIDVALDRLSHGDAMLHPKTGEVIRIPAKLRDAVSAINTMTDKRQLLMDKPTKIVEQRTIDERLDKLAAEFQKFTNIRVVNPVAIGEGDA